METNTTQAVVPQKPQKPATIKGWLESDQFKLAVKSALPSHLTAERFCRVALTCLMRQPKLAECSQESVFKAMLDLSSLGLEPDGRRAHLIPFANSKTGKTDVQLIVDWKGLVELAKRSGEVAFWQAHLVCQSDVFSWEDGVVHHKINWLEPRGQTRAVYSHVRRKDGEDDYEVMTLEEVAGIRKRSRAANAGPWVTDFDEMAKKTVIRRHSKRLTLSPEFHRALDVDADALDDTARITIAKPVFNHELADNLLEPVQAPSPVQTEQPSEPPKRIGRPPGSKNKPKEPEAPAPEADQETPKVQTPQDKLAEAIIGAGFTFDQFHTFARAENWLVEDKDSFEQVPTQACATILKFTDAFIADMSKFHGRSDV